MCKHFTGAIAPDELAVPYATLIGAACSNPHIHCAFLVPSPEIEHLVEQTIARGVLPMPVRIFCTAADAREWLGEISGSYRSPPLP